MIQKKNNFESNQEKWRVSCLQLFRDRVLWILRFMHSIYPHLMSMTLENLLDRFVPRFFDNGVDHREELRVAANVSIHFNHLWSLWLLDVDIESSVRFLLHSIISSLDFIAKSR